jgi:hypothetical protein
MINICPKVTATQVCGTQEPEPSLVVSSVALLWHIGSGFWPGMARIQACVFST